jgi:hypothetical protein
MYVKAVRFLFDHLPCVEISFRAMGPAGAAEPTNRPAIESAVLAQVDYQRVVER